jgi:exonuclease III
LFSCLARECGMAQAGTTDSAAPADWPAPTTDSGATPSAEPKPLLLGCWNVAGWEATLKYINLHYGSLSAFLDRHQFDILCLQEMKVTKPKIFEHNAAAQKLGAHGLDGWESYWSCSPKGFNGCTTFVRKGLTRRADAAPLGEPALDAEGR